MFAKKTELTDNGDSANHAQLSVIGKFAVRADCMTPVAWLLKEIIDKDLLY